MSGLPLNLSTMFVLVGYLTSASIYILFLWFQIILLDILVKFFCRHNRYILLIPEIIFYYDEFFSIIFNGAIAFAEFFTFLKHILQPDCTITLSSILTTFYVKPDYVGDFFNLMFAQSTSVLCCSF